MTEFRQARPGEEAEILDFINYVFSYSARPHDFRALLPKVYAKPDFSKYHFVALEDGRIRGTVATLPMEMRVDGGRSLHIGYVGSVSVHPYARGRGYMKQLMALLLRDARKQGMDMLVLGGLRQRYEYFGFESGGCDLSFSIGEDNIRHALKDVNADSVAIRRVESRDDKALDAMYALYQRQPMLCGRSRADFFDIMASWRADLYEIGDAKGGFLGYASALDGNIQELALADERCCPAFVKAWARQASGDYFTLNVSMHNRIRAGCVKSFAESYRVADSEKICVLSWQRTAQALLSFKAGCLPLSDGRFVFEVDGDGRYEILVRDHEPLVSITDDAPEMSFAPQRAVEFFFSPYTALMTASPLIKSWLPLTFAVSGPDRF